MNVAVKISKIFAAMSDHRSRKRGHRLRRDLDRAGNEKLIVRLHPENVERPTLNVQCRNQKANMSILTVSFDEADVAAAFDARDFYFRKVVGFGGQAHILLDVVFGDVVSTHGFTIESPVLDDHSRLSFD